MHSLDDSESQMHWKWIFQTVVDIDDMVVRSQRLMLSPGHRRHHQRKHSRWTRCNRSMKAVAVRETAAATSAVGEDDRMRSRSPPYGYPTCGAGYPPCGAGSHETWTVGACAFALERDVHTRGEAERDPATDQSIVRGLSMSISVRI